ncbi:hypothetical protein HDU97_005678 [Phlyctochytrium planicorne]|nr:hypothetical protein HDU97_005678 [Phlyctochytrium planicorne]
MAPGTALSSGSLSGSQGTEQRRQQCTPCIIASSDTNASTDKQPTTESSSSTFNESILTPGPLIKSSLDPLIACLEDISKSYMILFEDYQLEEPLELNANLFESEKTVRRRFIDSQFEYMLDMTSDDCLSLKEAPPDLALRFASSAFASRFSVPPAPQQIGISLFTKALEIVMRSCLDRPPSLKSLQAVLLTASCAFSFGNVGCVIKLVAVGIRMIEYLSNIKNPGKLMEDLYLDDPPNRCIWLRCMNLCYFFNDAFEITKVCPRLVENKQHIEDAVFMWDRYPNQDPPLIIIVSAIASILQSISSHTTEIPSNPDELTLTYARMTECDRQLTIWRDSLPTSRSFDDQGEWMIKEFDNSKPTLSPSLAVKYAGKFTAALSAAHAIADIGRQIVQLDRRKWSVECLHCFPVMWAGIIFADLAKLTCDDEVREELVEYVNEMVGILEAFATISPVIEIWVLELKAARESLFSFCS